MLPHVSSQTFRIKVHAFRLVGALIMHADKIAWPLSIESKDNAFLDFESKRVTLHGEGDLESRKQYVKFAPYNDGVQARMSKMR